MGGRGGSSSMQIGGSDVSKMAAKFMYNAAKKVTHCAEMELLKKMQN